MDVWQQVITTVGVLMAACGGIVTIGKAVEVIRSLRKPKETKERTDAECIKKIQDHLASDKFRLENHEREITGLKDGQKYLLQGVQALLGHELHNGNSLEMQTASDDIAEWLRER